VVVAATEASHTESGQVVLNRGNEGARPGAAEVEAPLKEIRHGILSLGDVGHGGKVGRGHHSILTRRSPITHQHSVDDVLQQSVAVSIDCGDRRGRAYSLDSKYDEYYQGYCDCISNRNGFDRRRTDEVR
jgi:hypothetical protein